MLLLLPSITADSTHFSRSSFTTITIHKSRYKPSFRLSAPIYPRERSEVFSDIPLEKPGYYIGAYDGIAALMLGSNEKRVGAGLMFEYGENYPFLRFRKYPGEFIFEFTIGESKGNGYLKYGPNRRVDVSILPMARWRGRPKDGRSLFIDLGLGLFFRNPTADVNSFISTQPTIDIGIDFHQGRHEWLAGLRLRHASNAGTKGPNAGENFVAVFAEYRF